MYFALYAAEDLTAADGSVIPADGLIEIAGVQADGTLVFASDLPIGSYYVKEYAVDAQYLISEETYPITFTYEDDTTAVVRIEVNNGEAILNRIIRGSITGIKVDEQGEPLPGAVFGLFRADCTDFTEENALLTAESAEDGSFSFENIPYGVWLVREIATSEGYVLSDEIFTVQVSENGAVIELGNLENRSLVNWSLPRKTFQTGSSCRAQASVSRTQTVMLSPRVIPTKTALPNSRCVTGNTPMRNSTPRRVTALIRHPTNLRSPRTDRSSRQR